MELDASCVKRIVATALDEDLGVRGDVTTDAVLREPTPARGRIVAREPLVLSGSEVAHAVFSALDPQATYRPLRSDGDQVEAGWSVAALDGDARSLLRGERTALNFLMRMSGIATAARAAVKEVAGTGCVILDTRKTAPGLRTLDKYAVACGGATNHRMGLHDAVMIKDTHLGTGCTIRTAVERALANGHPAEAITVEVRDCDQLQQAIAAGAGRALLDNMDLDALRGAVATAEGRIRLEASGGMRPGALRPVAETGVHFISVGWLTHSAKAANLAMELEIAP